MICMMKKSSAANFSSQHPTFFVLFRVAPQKLINSLLPVDPDQKLIISYIFNMWTLGARLIDGGLILSHWKHVLTSSYDRCIKEGLKGTLIRHGDHFSLKISHRHSRYYSSQVRRLNHFDIIIIVSERCASAFVLVDV